MKIGIICQHRSGHTAYEHYLNQTSNLPIRDELDLNFKNTTEYFENLPSNCIFSMMIREDSMKSVKKYKDINWRALKRKDVITQCLSFVYTNKTQDIRNKQYAIVDVDLALVDYFFTNYYLLDKLILEMKLPVFFYEDLDLTTVQSIRPTGNDYPSLIKNYNEVKDRIKKFYDS